MIKILTVLGVLLAVALACWLGVSHYNKKKEADAATAAAAEKDSEYVSYKEDDYDWLIEEALSKSDITDMNVRLNNSPIVQARADFSELHGGAVSNQEYTDLRYKYSLMIGRMTNNETRKYISTLNIDGLYIDGAQ